MPRALSLPRPAARRLAPRRRPSRLVVPAALAVAAVAVRGPVGVLLAIAALLVAVDLLIPMPSTSTARAEERFRRAVRRRRLAAAGRRVRGRAPERLLVLDDRHGWAAV